MSAEDLLQTIGALPPLRDIIARHGINARKSLGQHFLFDGNLTGRISAAAGNLSGIHVIEVGAGPGGLTRALMASAAQSVTAIERDERCLAALHELAEAVPGRLTVVAGDALELSPASLTPAPRRIVANLPYNVGTQLLLNWLAKPSEYEGFTLMFQREVAERITAKKGTKAYGRLSVLAQWLTEARILFEIQPSAFVPPPAVTSAVVGMEMRRKPLCEAKREDLELVTRLAFGQRRKMLRRALQDIGGSELLAVAGITETSRAEELTVEDFCGLARTYRSRSDARPQHED